MKAVILGAGGHAKVVIDILRESGTLELAGCLHQGGAGHAVSGIPVLGDDSLLPALLAGGTRHIFVALGDNALRLRMIDYVLSLGFTLLTAVSRHAVLSPSVEVGAGAAVMPGAVINADSLVGEGAIVNTGATVDHDCVLGRMSHVGPGSSLAGNVRIGAGSFLGTGTRVIPRIQIGEWSVTGAGAVVVADIPDRVLSVGVPARIVKRFS